MNIKKWLGGIWATIVSGGNPASSGGIEPATQQEVLDGINTTDAVTPATLQAKLATLAGGSVPNATEVEAGVARIATQAEVNSGSAVSAIVTPDKLSAKLTSMDIPSSTMESGFVKGRVSFGSGTIENLSPAQIRTLLNVESGANAYFLPTASDSVLGGVKVSAGNGLAYSNGTLSHSSADGSLHIPANGSSNNGKVLTSGDSPGAVSWATPPSAPAFNPLTLPTWTEGTENRGGTFKLTYAGNMAGLSGSALRVDHDTRSIRFMEDGGDWRGAHLRIDKGTAGAASEILTSSNFHDYITVGATYVNVKSYGALGDNSNNDTAAMQDAHDTGNVIYYPAGRYKFSSISMSSGGIIGDGPRTKLICTATSGDHINVKPALGAQSFEAPMFKDFTADQEIGDCYGGSYFCINPTGNEMQRIYFGNVTIWNSYRAIYMGNAASWNITDCRIQNYHDCGIHIHNNFCVDSGDSAITGTLIGNGRVAGVGIFQSSSGGLRLVSNKINVGNYGYLMQLTENTSTSILNMIGNSIENQSISAIAFNIPSTSVFYYINIVGNELAICPYSIMFNTLPSGAVLSGINIANNSMQASTACVQIGSGVSDFIMCGNNMRGTGYGLIVDTGALNGRVYGNLIQTSNTPITNNGSNVIVSF